MSVPNHYRIPAEVSKPWLLTFKTHKLRRLSLSRVDRDQRAAFGDV